MLKLVRCESSPGNPHHSIAVQYFRGSIYITMDYSVFIVTDTKINCTCNSGHTDQGMG